MELQILLNVGYLILIAIISFVTVKVKTIYLEDRLNKIEKQCLNKEELMGEMQVKLAEFRTQALTEQQARKLFVSKEEFKAHLDRLDEMDKALREKLDFIIKLLVGGGE